MKSTYFIIELLKIIVPPFFIYAGYRGIRKILLDEAIKIKVTDNYSGNKAVAVLTMLCIKQLGDSPSVLILANNLHVNRIFNEVNRIYQTALEKNASLEVITLCSLIYDLFKDLPVSNSSKGRISNLDTKLLDSIYTELLFILADYSANQVILPKKFKLVPLTDLTKKFKRLLKHDSTNRISDLTSGPFRSSDYKLSLRVFEVLNAAQLNLFYSLHKAFFEFQGHNNLLLIQLMRDKYYLPIVIETPFNAIFGSMKCEIYLVKYENLGFDDKVAIWYTDKDPRRVATGALTAKNFESVVDNVLMLRTNALSSLEQFINHGNQIISFTMSAKTLSTYYNGYQYDIKRKIKQLGKTGQL